MSTPPAPLSATSLATDPSSGASAAAAYLAAARTANKPSSPVAVTTPRRTPARNPGADVDAFISWDGYYSCHRIDFSKLSAQQFDFDGVESIDVHGGAVAASKTHTAEQQQQQQGAPSPAPPGASPGGAGATTTSVTPGGAASARGAALEPESRNHYLDAEPFLLDTVRGGGGGGGDDAMHRTSSMHFNDTVALFDASPLHQNLRAPGAPAASQSDVDARRRALAHIIHRLHRTIDKQERETPKRFWLFQHVRGTGVTMYVFSHENDLVAFVRENIPGADQAWGQPSGGGSGGGEAAARSDADDFAKAQSAVYAALGRKTAAGGIGDTSKKRGGGGAEGGEGADGADGGGDEGDEQDRSSHSSSTDATTASLADTTYWLDIQCDDNNALLTIMKNFPSIRRETFESFVSHSDRHSMRHFSHHGYLACIFTAVAHHQQGAAAAAGDSANVNNVNDSSGGGGGGGDKDGTSQQQRMQDRDASLLQVARRAKMCALLSKRLAITFHREPVRGLGAVIKRLHLQFKSGAAAAAQAAADEQLKHNNNNKRAAGEESEDSDSAHADNAEVAMMSPGWVLSMLYNQCVHALVPDVAALTQVIEMMDAQILINSASEVGADGRAAGSGGDGGDGDDDEPPTGEEAGHSPLMMRVARFRRGIAEHRANLTRKEHLTSLLSSPKMSVCSYINCDGTQQRLHDMMPLIQRSLQQLDALREILTQCNSNLMASISIAQANASNKMAAQMTQLSVIATITMPFALLTGVFGMNVPIPWQSADDYKDLNAFGVIAGLLAIWAISVFVVLKATEYCRRS